MPLPFHRRRLDPDAADFCRRSGAEDRAAINAFVRGVKALGLWNSMVCWPLRSSQNAGTGTTAYSLGGLGAFDGTLVNGPTWGSNFVSVAVGQSIDLNTSFWSGVDYTRTLGSVSLFNTNGARTRIWNGTPSLRYTTQTTVESAGANVGVQVFVRRGGAAAPTALDSVAYTNGVPFMGTAEFSSPTQVRGFINDRPIQTFSGLTAEDATTENTAKIEAFLQTTEVAFVFALFGPIHPSFYSLYKTTLGTGLSLP